MRYAVIVGATGLTGMELARLLAAQRQAVPVRALLRRAAPELPAGIEQVILDKLDDPEDLLQHIPTGAWVFCCIGTTMAKARSQDAFRAVDVDIPVALAQAASRAGADGFSIVSSAGAKANGFFFYTRTKGEMEEEIKATDLPAIHIFRPSLLLGPRRERRLGERLGQLLGKVLAPFWRGPLSRYSPVKAVTVAQAMLNCARKGQSGIQVFEGDELVRAAS